MAEKTGWGESLDQLAPHWRPEPYVMAGGYGRMKPSQPNPGSITPVQVSLAKKPHAGWERLSDMKGKPMPVHPISVASRQIAAARKPSDTYSIPIPYTSVRCLATETESPENPHGFGEHKNSLHPYMAADTGNTPKHIRIRNPVKMTTPSSGAEMPGIASCPAIFRLFFPCHFRSNRRKCVSLLATSIR